MLEVKNRNAVNIQLNIAPVGRDAEKTCQDGDASSKLKRRQNKFVKEQRGWGREMAFIQVKPG